MKTSYSERDATFSQVVLTLRTTIGLSRCELANRLRVSRQAVGEWEAGKTYPKVAHLKALIVLAIQQQAFPAGREAEEIRQFWKAARQKVPLNERWLSELLSWWHSPQRRSHEWLHVGPAHEAEQAQASRDFRMTDPLRSFQPLRAPTAPVEEIAPVVTRPGPGTRVDWGDALAIPVFYGREEELSLLSQWVVQERHRVVSILGIGGIGKSVLAVKIMHQLAEQFEVVIFRSLRDAPSCESLLDECLQVLSPRPQGPDVPTTLEQRISLLLTHLRKTRAIVVLDNLESLLQEGDARGHLRPGFEGYGQLLHRVIEIGHQSCLLLTSREKPAELRLLEGRYSSSVRSLRLTGLDVAACKLLLEEKGVAPEFTPGIGNRQDQEQLIEVYAGNPLALKIVADTIIDLFEGKIAKFLAEGTVIVGNITDLLDKQFARLSALEQNMLCWLAIAREPMTLNELHSVLVTPLLRIQILEAIDGLRRRSLIEPGKRPGSFTLQSVVLEYVTSVLIAEATSEIQQCRLNRLIEHGLEAASTKEYVRQTQERLLLSPLLRDLQHKYRRQAELEEQLLSLLNQLRNQPDAAQGYGPANLIVLLRMLRGHLSGLDLSQLSIRGAYLQNVEMRDTSLARALMLDPAFTQAINATWAVAINRDGTLWAAGGILGKVHVWEEGTQTLCLIWQAHTHIVQALAFSPDGRTLATGSLDGTVKLWDLGACTHGASPRDALLWTGWQSGPQSLAFSPDGTLLVSGGVDTTVRLWDPQSGVNLQTLRHPGPVFGVAFSPDGSLLASSCFDGEIRLWERQKTESRGSAETLLVQANRIMNQATSLAFAPDGKTLASAGWDRMIKLWEIPSGRLLYTLPGQTDPMKYVAWSPDGRTLACSSYEKAIWLWDIEQGRYRAGLVGHTADVYGIAFTPDSSRLLSGSADCTLRVWDLKSCQCMHIIAGYAVALYDLDWSPDGTRLISSGTDGLVTIWDLSEGRPPRVLRGHRWVVYGVGWSPDGRFVASCGWDKTIRLWDPNSGACTHMFGNQPVVLQGMAWSLDGSLLACGTYLQGMQVWDVEADRLHWVGQPDLVGFIHVAWSPDGTKLVASGDDGNVYLWKGTDGTLLYKLSGHRNRVNSVVWSPDGTRLASGSGSGCCGELFVWDVQSGECVHTFLEHPSVVYALAWIHSPSGDQLITGGGDGMLRWWDVQSGRCVCVQAAHQGTIQSLRVSPDGRQLGSCGNDGTIRIWDLYNGEHLQTLRQDRPYERLNITEIRGLTEAQKASLLALGAFEEQKDETRNNDAHSAKPLDIRRNGIERPSHFNVQTDAGRTSVTRDSH